MSSDTDYRGCFTESELRAGIVSIVFGATRDDDLDDDEDGSLANESTRHLRESRLSVSAERFKNGVKLIAALESVEQIKRRLTHKLLRENTDYAIGRYLRSEDVPAIYWNMVKSHDCIEKWFGLFEQIFPKDK